MKLKYIYIIKVEKHTMNQKKKKKKKKISYVLTLNQILY